MKFNIDCHELKLKKADSLDGVWFEPLTSMDGKWQLAIYAYAWEDAEFNPRIYYDLSLLNGEKEIDLGAFTFDSKYGGFEPWGEESERLLEEHGVEFEMSR